MSTIGEDVAKQEEGVHPGQSLNRKAKLTLEQRKAAVQVKRRMPRMPSWRRMTSKRNRITLSHLNMISHVDALLDSHNLK